MTNWHDGIFLHWLTWLDAKRKEAAAKVNLFDFWDL